MGRGVLKKVKLLSCWLVPPVLPAALNRGCASLFAPIALLGASEIAALQNPVHHVAGQRVTHSVAMCFVPQVSCYPKCSD